MSEFILFSKLLQLKYRQFDRVLMRFVFGLASALARPLDSVAADLFLNGETMEIEKKLKSLGFDLPNPPVPAANYIGSVRVGNLLFVGGNIGRINGALKYRGKVGGAVTLEQAYEAARNCALNHLALIKAALGDLDRVERIVKVLGYVNVAPGFTEMPKVVNGESDLLVQLWGERGQHTRAAVGVAALSQDSPVETEVTVQVKE
jgi:enamine deaminase RidA (YjgF/YER057c/UK114 family)